MKILWVTPWFGNYRVPVYDYLNKMTGGNFHLICSVKDTSDLVREKLKATLRDNVTILQNEKRLTLGNEGTTFANKTLVLKWQPGLYNAISAINPDVLIVEGFGSWSPAGIAYSVLHRKKLCMFYERTAYVERNSPAFRTLYRKIIGKPVDCFLVNGQLTKDYVSGKLNFDKKTIVKGCMCADSYSLARLVDGVTAADKEKLKQDLKLQDGLTYLFVGQMVERKGIKNLLAVWNEHIQKHPTDNLVVIGTGILKESLKEQYANIPSIHILGGISYDNLHVYYALCDVFIMPTLEDNWCLVIPEAMACGKAVACSIYNGGHYELVKNGVNGYNFDPQKPQSIVEVLDKFHGEDLAAMGEQSRKIESDYTPDKAAQRMYDACKSLMEE